MTSVSNYPNPIRKTEEDPPDGLYLPKRARTAAASQDDLLCASTEDFASSFAGYMSLPAVSDSSVEEPDSPSPFVPSILASPVSDSETPHTPDSNALLDTLDESPPSSTSSEVISASSSATLPVEEIALQSSSSAPPEVAPMSVRERLLQRVMDNFNSFAFSDLPRVKKELEIIDNVLPVRDMADVYFSFGKAMVLAFEKKQDPLVIRDILECLNKGVRLSKQTGDPRKIKQIDHLFVRFVGLSSQRPAPSPLSLSDALPPPSTSLPSLDCVFPDLDSLNEFVKSNKGNPSRSLIATLYLNYGYAQLELYKQKRDPLIVAELFASHKKAMEFILIEDILLQTRADNLIGIFFETRNEPGDLRRAVFCYRNILELNKGQNLLGTEVTSAFQLAIQRVLGLMGRKVVLTLPPKLF